MGKTASMYIVHYNIRLLCHRTTVGVHYSVVAVRYITNLIFTHIALSWQVKLPGGVDQTHIRCIEEAIAKENKFISTFWEFHLPRHSKLGSRCLGI